MLAIPLMMALFPPRYTDTAGLIALMVFYGIAKLLEWQDHSIAAFLATGGHPWKHAAAAAFCYLDRGGTPPAAVLCCPQVGSLMRITVRFTVADC